MTDPEHGNGVCQIADELHIPIEGGHAAELPGVCVLCNHSRWDTHLAVRLFWTSPHTRWAYLIGIGLALGSQFVFPPASHLAVLALGASWRAQVTPVTAVLPVCTTCEQRRRRNRWKPFAAGAAMAAVFAAAVAALAYRDAVMRAAWNERHDTLQVEARCLSQPNYRETDANWLSTTPGAPKPSPCKPSELEEVERARAIEEANDRLVDVHWKKIPEPLIGPWVIVGLVGLGACLLLFLPIQYFAARGLPVVGATHEALILRLADPSEYARLAKEGIT